MSGADNKLAVLRAKRDAARADLLRRIEAAKALQNPKVLGQRIKADIELHSRNALVQAMEIAGDNRGVLAGTLTALGLWLARRQVLAKASPLLARAKARISGLWRGKKAGIDESLG